MKSKGNMKTVRLTNGDMAAVDQFLTLNPAIENFSALARIAVLDFVSKRGSIPLRPIIKEEPSKRPSFLWDYDVSEGEIREMIVSSFEKRKWIVAKILEHARFDEVWNYLTPVQIERDLPSLRLPKKTKDHWTYALKRWKQSRLWKS